MTRQFLLGRGDTVEGISLHTGHVILSARALHTQCDVTRWNPGWVHCFFYFLTNPSLLIKWRLKNNLTSLMSGHEFYCYCILINLSLFQRSSIALSHSYISERGRKSHLVCFVFRRNSGAFRKFIRNNEFVTSFY